MLSTQLTARLFGALILGQAVSALPTSTTNAIGVRWDPKILPTGLPGVFSGKNHPALEDLEAAMPIVLNTSGVDNGAKDWLPILLGFHKSNTNWALSLFPFHDDKPPAYGQAWVKLFNPWDKTWPEQTVAFNSTTDPALELVNKLLPKSNISTVWNTNVAWWPWALLGASQTYAPDQNKLDIARSIEVLSGIKATVLEGGELEDKLKDDGGRKNLFDEVYSKAEFSPIWMQLEENGNYTVALKTYGTDDLAVHTDISYFELPGKALESEPNIDFTKLHVGNIPLKDFSPKKIIHLEGFPSYDEGTEEWKKK